ncbi:MAG TPA: hypothetical protein VF530_15395 [Planctomycetota bacterium]
MSLAELRLSPFGLFHTAIALAAVLAGVVALVRHGALAPRSRAGRLYVGLTALAALTGLAIFRHGAFGKPHALAVLTLLVLGLAALAGRGHLGRASAAIETVAYSATLFFHSIPGLAESLTRLPPGAPLFDDPEAPGLQRLAGLAFLLFLAGAWRQVRRLRRDARVSAVSAQEGVLAPPDSSAT